MRISHTTKFQRTVFSIPGNKVVEQGFLLSVHSTLPHCTHLMQFTTELSIRCDLSHQPNISC